MVQQETTHERLSVNINDETAAILRRYTQHRDVNTTEAIRRAVGVLGYFLDADMEGKKVFVIDPEGNECSVRMP